MHVIQESIILHLKNARYGGDYRDSLLRRIIVVGESKIGSNATRKVGEQPRDNFNPPKNWLGSLEPKVAPRVLYYSFSIFCTDN